VAPSGVEHRVHPPRYPYEGLDEPVMHAVCPFGLVFWTPSLRHHLPLGPIPAGVVGAFRSKRRLSTHHGRIENAHHQPRGGRHQSGSGFRRSIADDQRCQNASVNSRSTVKISSRPSSMARQSSHLAASGSDAKLPAGPTTGPNPGPTLVEERLPIRAALGHVDHGGHQHGSRQSHQQQSEDVNDWSELDQALSVRGAGGTCAADPGMSSE
jgi:hypothetical protein